MPDIRSELLRLSRMPPWGRVQGDDWDARSGFIYRIRSLDELRRETKRVAAEARLPENDFARYVIHRWYNYHTHQVALEILYAQPGVRREQNPRHHTIDLYLNSVPFDLKLTRFPRAYPSSLAYARAHPRHLIYWLYQNQSTQGRYHTANRLFMLFHHAREPERTWEVRRMFDLVERAIVDFARAPALFQVDVEGGQSHSLAGLIPCIYE